MRVPVIHFLEDVTLVFLELTQRVSLDLRDLVSLPLQLGVELLNQFTLLFKSFLLLGDNGLLNLLRLFGQILKNFALFLHSSILLSLQVNEIFVHLSVNRGQLVVQTLNAIVSLLRKHVFELCHAVVATAILALLVFVLRVELVLHLGVQVPQLLIIPDLVGLQRVVHFLTLIDCILLDVLDFPIEKRSVTGCRVL